MSNEEDQELETQDESLNDNASDEKFIKRRRQKLKNAEKQEAEFWRQVMNSEIGRRAIWKKLEEAHIFDTRFACGPNGFPQSEATWFAAGVQDFGLRFYHMLARNDRILLLKMHDENDPYYLVNNKFKETN